MFIGHYGVSYAVKKTKEDIPLWLLFAAVQLLDLIAFTLVLFGIEGASFTPNENPFFRNHLVLPFSHSLVGAVVVSLVVYFAFRVYNKKKWSLVLGLCVLSHWFIDLLVHTNDLPILFGGYSIGLGLWNYPYFTFAIEIIFALTGWLLIKRRNIFSYILLFLLIAGFTGMTFGSEPEIMQNSAALRTSVVLFANGLFILFAFLSDRKGKRSNIF
jgi:hypothetical protein